MMTLWESISAWIHSVPDVIWSGVIASVITLSGVLISNAGTTRRLRIQHQHESKEKSKERLTNARREIYLAAANEFSLALGHLGNITQLDPRKDNLTAPLQAFNSTVAKIQLVAESSTVDLATHAAQLLAELYFKLITKAQPIFELKFEEEFKTKAYELSQSEVDRVIKQQRILVESPHFDGVAFELLKQALSGFQQQALENMVSLRESLDKRLALQRTYTSELATEIKPLVEAQFPLSVALRRELELETDLEKLKRRSDDGLGFAKSLLEKLRWPEKG